MTESYTTIIIGLGLLMSLFIIPFMVIPNSVESKEVAYRRNRKKYYSYLEPTLSEIKKKVDAGGETFFRIDKVLSCEELDYLKNELTKEYQFLYFDTRLSIASSYSLVVWEML